MDLHLFPTGVLTRHAILLQAFAQLVSHGEYPRVEAGYIPDDLPASAPFFGRLGDFQTAVEGGNGQEQEMTRPSCVEGEEAGVVACEDGGEGGAWSGGGRVAAGLALA